MDKVNFTFEYENIFSSASGYEIFYAVKSAIADFGMEEDLKKGVVVGFSGGGDSVLLLLALLNLKKSYDFPLAAIHVNHGIRGEEADYDQSFSEEFCRYLCVPYFSKRVDVPLYSGTRKIGTEEAARELRYAAFEEIISSHPEYNTVATAHNATDNTETVVFNILRGSGARGLSGIAPKRGKIIRPIIYIPKEKITAFLSENRIPYVTDSTNNSLDYTRNYIRHKILPEFKVLNGDYESSVTKITAAIREDESFINSIADEFIEKNYKCGRMFCDLLRSQPKALLFRVLRGMAEKVGISSLERVHVAKIMELLCRGGNFSFDVPMGFRFISEYGFCFFEKKSDRIEKLTVNDKAYPLTLGANIVEDLGVVITLSYDKTEIFSSNVYKFSIQVKLPFDIILNDLYVRTKKDGDSYFYGGMTRSVKKLFSDKKIPKEKRMRMPVVCDKSGILWIPGFGVRCTGDDTRAENPLWVTVYERI